MDEEHRQGNKAQWVKAVGRNARGMKSGEQESRGYGKCPWDLALTEEHGGKPLQVSEQGQDPSEGRG